MIIIYDFDGTLTPYSLPQYEILRQTGYTDEILMKRINKEIENGNAVGIYDSYYKCYRDILRENGIIMSRNNICLGAKSVKFNNGVIEYFKKFQSSKTGIKHYIVTSGIKDYIEETAISKLVDGIYGVTFKKENEMLRDVDFLLTDEKKVEVIRKIQNENNGTQEIVYFGDGLTDKFAFEYVHSIGGKNIFILSNEKSKENYKKLNINQIIDECFDSDFSIDSKISKYIESKIEESLAIK